MKSKKRKTLKAAIFTTLANAIVILINEFWLKEMSSEVRGSLVVIVNIGIYIAYLHLADLIDNIGIPPNGLA